MHVAVSAHGAVCLYVCLSSRLFALHLPFLVFGLIFEELVLRGAIHTYKRAALSPRRICFLRSFLLFELYFRLSLCRVCLYGFAATIDRQVQIRRSYNIRRICVATRRSYRAWRVVKRRSYRAWRR